MAVNAGTNYFLFPPVGTADGKVIMHDSFLGPIPVIFAGKGTPTEDIAPFVNCPKGSVYIQMDAADDAVAWFIKVDDANAGDDSDWGSFSHT